ncbi:MAG: hypothetical protein R3E44_01115 [Paracoccaceae bacterium]
MTRIRENEERREFAEEAPSLWRITFGPVIWALHFVLLYGGTAVHCARGRQAALSFAEVRLAVVVFTVLALAGIAWFGWRSWSQWDVIADREWENDKGTSEDRHQFLGHAAFLLAVISFIGVAYVALPFVFIENCR